MIRRVMVANTAHDFVFCFRTMHCANDAYEEALAILRTWRLPLTLLCHPLLSPFAIVCYCCYRLL